ncbi:nucleotide exchange factor GrpE [Candidatus Daviesbacteria bacterium]|nr:nucleotide exchange factor GrpE [Candidatus Daviesbacteria bacterium]
MGKKANDRINEIIGKNKELEAQLKRAVADYHNLEKRVSEGRSELTSFMGAELVKRLLPVLDHLEQVVDRGRPILSERSESKDWFRGVELAVKELNQVLQSEGLDEISADPSTSLGTGSVFDPSLHEAVDTKDGEDNKIIEVVRKGYNLNGKVLRPAQVIVGRKQDNHPEERNSDEGSSMEDSGQARMTENEGSEGSTN